MTKTFLLVAGLALGTVSMADATVLFNSPFTTTASLDAGWNAPGNSGSAVIATAPGGGAALTFGATDSGGDLFTTSSFTSGTGSFKLTFDYLGNCGQTSQCGAFVGANGGTPNNGGWILSDTPYGGIPNDLPDSGKWVHVSYTFGGTGTDLFLEDFGGSAYSGGNEIYFKNMILTDNPGGTPLGTLTFTSTSVPEPATWAMMLVGVGGLGGALRRRSAKTIAA